MALVTLRNPGTHATVADVPMLVDTGADVTLLPQAMVEQLGVAIETSAGYELKGFDGHLSVAHSVEADLLFLSRAFKGRFLLIGDSCGAGA